MKIWTEEDGIRVEIGDLSFHYLFGSPEVNIRNESDGTLVGSMTETHLDVSKLGEYIHGLSALRAELAAMAPITAKDYVAEREDAARIHASSSRCEEVRVFTEDGKPKLCPVCSEGYLQRTSNGDGTFRERCSMCSYSRSSI
jgi:hypothetical protein